jgi:hypothetical protein
MNPLNRDQRRALAVIAENAHNGCSPLALCAIFTLDVLDALEEAGLIARHEMVFSNPRGLRAERYRITPAGQEALQ